jgi:hypothetical protein
MTLRTESPATGSGRERRRRSTRALAVVVWIGVVLLNAAPAANAREWRFERHKCAIAVPDESPWRAESATAVPGLLICLMNDDDRESVILSVAELRRASRSTMQR